MQHDSGGHKCELEMLKATTEKQKNQLQQLQELLVLREQEHRCATLLEFYFSVINISILSLYL